MPPKAKALDKKAANEEAASSRKKAEQDAAEAAAWSVGAKDSSKDAAKAAAEQEKLRKAAEKAAALAADEEMTAAVVSKVAKAAKKKDAAFAELDKALASAPKTKAQKEAEEKKKLAEQQKKKEEEARAAKDAKRLAELDEMKKNAARGIVMGHADELMMHTRDVNRPLDDEDDLAATGLEGAIDVLSGLGASSKGKGGGEASIKALYNAFLEREMPILRQENPGLKLSQLNERIFDKWQRSGENPKNQKSRSGPVGVFKVGEGGCMGEEEG